MEERRNHWIILVVTETTEIEKKHVEFGLTTSGSVKEKIILSIFFLYSI